MKLLPFRKRAFAHGEAPGPWSPARLLSLHLREAELAEPVRALAHHITSLKAHQGRRGLAICAPSPGAGVSFIASNLAVALAQSGIETLIIDGNLGRPGLDGIFGLDPSSKGLGDLLSDTSLWLGDVIQPSLVPQLSVLTVGGPDAAGDVDDGRLQDIIDSAERQFDFTLIDTPAANGSASTLRLASAVGYAVIVARRNDSFASDVAVLSDALRRTGVEVVGAVLNEI